MKPARGLVLEGLIPSDSAGLQLRHCCVSAIVASERGTYSKTALRKIEAVASRAADAIMFHPADQRLVHATLVNQILKKFPNRIIGERGDNRGVQTETTLQSPRDVVLPSAFAHFERSRVVNAPVARVEPHHDFAQADQVPTAVFLRLDRQHHQLTPTASSR